MCLGDVFIRFLFVSLFELGPFVIARECTHICLRKRRLSFVLLYNTRVYINRRVNSSVNAGIKVLRCRNIYLLYL